MITHKIIGENEKSLKKKHDIQIKDVRETKYLIGKTEYTHRIYIKLPENVLQEQQAQIEKDWKVINKLHAFDNGSEIILPWTISGALCFLCAGVGLLKQSCRGRV